MSSLGFALIVKNEETCLQRCLNSIKSVADEIVIVDTGSTDRTKEIALQYTNKVYDFPWIDDFAAARNFSFSLVSSDFIMWLDADDEILPKDIEKIKNLNFSDDKEVFICKYHYSHDQFGAPECTLERERIVRRSLGLKWEKAIHEYIAINGRAITRTDIEIHHWKKHGTSERNIRILEKIVENDPDPRNLFYLGKEYLDFGKIEGAIKFLEKFVVTNGWWEDVFVAHQLLAKAYLTLKNENKFFENIFLSIKIEPRRAEPFYDLGDFYFSKGDWGKAIHYYETCLNVKRSPELLSTFFPQYYTWLPALALCMCYNNIGNIQKAYEYNELFIKFRPGDSKGIHNRAVLKDSPLRLIRKDGQGKRLNLGCGNKRMEGFVNCDIVNIKEVDEIFNFYEIPYQDNTISEISSEHALEHVPKEKAKQAIKEWFRVLKPGGVLNLYIPDLELCALGYVNGDNKRTVNGYPEKDWYKMTLFGAQTAENGSDAEHQFHLTGFSKNEIKEILEDAGFVIEHLSNY